MNKQQKATSEKWSNNDDIRTTKPLIKNWSNRHLFPSKGEYNSGEQVTIPDQAYTIPQIFEKFRRGVPINVNREVYYQDSDDFDNVDYRQIAKDPYDIDEIEVAMRKRMIQPQKAVHTVDRQTETNPEQSDGSVEVGQETENSLKEVENTASAIPIT